MKKIALLSLVFVTTFVSCKNNEVSEKESVSTEGSAEAKQDTVFTITLNATVLKDDSFQVYYKNFQTNLCQQLQNIYLIK